MSRFEIVRTIGRGYDRRQLWRARYVASNGRVVWTTETYQRRSAALNAIKSLIDPFLGQWVDQWWYPDRNAHGVAVVYRASSWEKRNGLLIEIRDVDERGGAES